MPKILAIAAAAFLAVAACGYCILWYVQASQTKTSIEQAIANLNKEHPYITYESIQAYGFPSDVNVAIVKPRFTGRIDTLLKAVAQNAPAPSSPRRIAQLNTLSTLPEWNEDIALDGSIVLSVNALSDHYTFRTIGNLHETGQIAGKPSAITATYAGEGSCSVQFQRSNGILGALWTYKTLARTPEVLLHELRMLDCNQSANSITDTATQEKLASSGPFRFYITSAPQGADWNARFYMKVNDTEFTPAGDALIASFYSAIYPNLSFPPKLSLEGKQNMEMDFSYAGPSDLKNAGKNPNIAVNLSKFELSNDSGSVSAVFNISNSTAANSRKARLNFKTDMSFTDKYDTHLRYQLHNLAQQLYTGNDPSMAELQAFIQPYKQKYSADEMFNIVYPALPQFTSLGHVVQALDVSYTGDPAQPNGDVKLSTLELSATPYGITGQGDAKITAGHPIPAANITLSCRNCAAMIDDMARYAVRVQTMLSYFNPQRAAAMTVSAQQIDGVKAFLAALAEPAASDPATQNFTIISDGGTGITISGKRPDEIMALFQQDIAPYLNKPQPAAAP